MKDTWFAYLFMADHDPHGLPTHSYHQIRGVWTCIQVDSSVECLKIVLQKWEEFESDMLKEVVK